MAEKLITVTIPSFKQPKLLIRALKSLSDQTYKHFYTVIIDDASNSNFDLIRNAFSKKLNLEIIRNPYNIGAMNNIHKSIFYPCKTKYILSLHEDDYLANSYLENALRILEQDDQISFVSTRPEWILRHSKYKKFSQSRDLISSLYSSSDLSLAIMKLEPIMFSSILYRRSHLIDAWNYDKYNTFCDLFFLLKILIENKTICVQIKTPGIRVSDHSKEQIDNRSKDATFNHFLKLFIFYLDTIQPFYNVITYSPWIFRYLLVGTLLFTRKKLKF